MSHELCCNLESGFVGCSFVNFLNAKISDQWSVLLDTGQTHQNVVYQLPPNVAEVR